MQSPLSILFVCNLFNYELCIAVFCYEIFTHKKLLAQNISKNIEFDFFKNGKNDTDIKNKNYVILYVTFERDHIYFFEIFNC